MEVVRMLQESDPNFYRMLNRPHEDVEQRTKDLDRIFTPARGLRVRQVIPASSDVEVEIGIYIDPNGTTIRRSNTGSIQTIAVPASSAGQIRADLIYFNLTTGLAVRLAGSEVPSGGGFSTALWPDLPSGLAGSIPLAILYVDESLTFYDETIVTDVAGRIIDIRPAIGANRSLFSTGTPPSDVAGGAPGTSPTMSRGDHRHERNVDVTVPETLDGVKAAAAGIAATYAIRDHIHPISVESNAANIQPDGVASVGSGANLVKANHVHPRNTDATLPANVSTVAAVSGAAATYAKRDHVHLLPATVAFVVGYVTSKVLAFSGNITVTSGTWLIEVFGRYHQAVWSNVNLVIDGTTVDSSGNFGDQDGTGYVVVSGFKVVVGSGTYAFSMTNASAFLGGGPLMYAKAFKVG
jgi:hypothetical protein